mmetsp:Transcript_20022/g.55391  ORF Transcript_20022/g.55391 Transcript_20022/m.55391 type:complete len:281 (-) Transcript_20022:341-1183(-)
MTRHASSTPVFEPAATSARRSAACSKSSAPMIATNKLCRSSVLRRCATASSRKASACATPAPTFLRPPGMPRASLAEVLVGQPAGGASARNRKGTESWWSETFLRPRSAALVSQVRVISNLSMTANDTLLFFKSCSSFSRKSIRLRMSEPPDTASPPWIDVAESLTNFRTSLKSSIYSDRRPRPAYRSTVNASSMRSSDISPPKMKRTTSKITLPPTRPKLKSKQMKIAQFLATRESSPVAFLEASPDASRSWSKEPTRSTAAAPKLAPKSTCDAAASAA